VDFQSHLVELHRWDDVSAEWDHEATFRTLWRAKVAAEAMTDGDRRTTYRIDDNRSKTRYYFRYGVEVPPCFTGGS
jgi:hypothetical protein